MADTYNVKKMRWEHGLCDKTSELRFLPNGENVWYINKHIRNIYPQQDALTFNTFQIQHLQ